MTSPLVRVVDEFFEIPTRDFAFSCSMMELRGRAEIALAMSELRRACLEIELGDGAERWSIVRTTVIPLLENLRELVPDEWRPSEIVPKKIFADV